MKERAELLGPHRGLLGIVTEPDGPDDGAARPAIVLLNAGLMHRIGPFRLYVLLARALAKAGFTVLRLDLSSKGDSPPRPGARSYRESVRADLADAFEHLQRTRGLSRFVLLGLCSGADDAFRNGVDDARVAGIALLDGYAYRTPKFWLRHYGPRLLRPAKWLGFLARLLLPRRDAAGAGGEPVEDVYGMAFPPREEFAQGLRKMLARKAAVLVVHTAGWYGYYNYAEQFRDAFPEIAADPAVTVCYFGRADHTYTLAADRRQLIELVCDWAGRNFGREAGRHAATAATEASAAEPPARPAVSA